MSAFDIITAVSIAFLAGSYGWGMRGSALGGEKGAMLPGALLGMLMCWFSGNEFLRENYLFFAAAGAIGMYFGGTETYGQTIAFVLKNRPNQTFKKGFIGLMLKGACWFGIFGAVVGTAFSLKLGLIEYKPKALLAITLATIPIRYLGILVFNSPYKPSEGKFPKLNFSVDRREEWGGLLLALVAIIVFLAANRYYFALSLCAAGIFGGSVGWAIGILLFYRSTIPNKSGKKFCAALDKKGILDGWKTMEMALGGFAAMSIMLCFMLGMKHLSWANNFGELPLKANEMLMRISADGIFGFKLKISEDVNAVFIALCSLWLISSAQYGIVVLLKKDNKKYSRIMDSVNRVIYAYFPLMLLICGNKSAAFFVAVTQLFYVLAEQQIFENYKNFSGLALLGTLSFAACLITPILWIKYGWQPSMLMLFICYLVIYEVSEIIRFFRPKELAAKKALMKKKKLTSKKDLFCSFGGVASVHSAFVAEILVLIVFGVCNFT